MSRCMNCYYENVWFCCINSFGLQSVLKGETTCNKHFGIAEVAASSDVMMLVRCTGLDEAAEFAGAGWLYCAF
jgi:hypothetical protein